MQIQHTSNEAHSCARQSNDDFLLTNEAGGGTRATAVAEADQARINETRSRENKTLLQLEAVTDLKALILVKVGL